MKTETTLFILCGEAFAGKSTMSKKLAEKYNLKIVGRDAVYFSLKETLALDETPEEDDEELWSHLWPVAVQGAKNQLFLGNSVVFDDNCLYKKQREELYVLAEKLNAKKILIYLDIPTETLRQRKEENKKNPTRHDVPSAWLDEDHEIFERPTQDEQPLVFDGQTEIEEWIKRFE
ncbi:MAG TPA: AAA family ATPase [Candidatus Paceibacterota bacterium]|jgi:predicted kinase|nr:AAA family ATPase [Candidatus Paceibacterota bacterium]